MRTTCSSEAVESLQRRQAVTTWGIVALAVFVSVGMAEWSKRSAAGEVIVDEKVLQQAMAIAAEARDSGVKGLRGEGISKFEIRNSKSENNLSDLSVSAVKPSSTAVAGRPQTRSEIGGAPSAISQLPSSIRSVSGEIQTSAGGGK
jgi:hypothetical protein